MILSSHYYGAVFELACYGTIEKENYHMQDITLLVESDCMDIDIKMPLRWYFL